MSGFFNLRSLLFYSGSLGAVVLLFIVATAYGENQLKAPPRIDGHYRVTATNLPACLANQPLLLIVQQSGIYLNGTLVAEQAGNEPKKEVEKPTLRGIWNGSLSLEGTVHATLPCPDRLMIQARVEPGSTPSRDRPTGLQGTLQLGSTAPVEFSATLENPQEVKD